MSTIRDVSAACRRFAAALIVILVGLPLLVACGGGTPGGLRAASTTKPDAYDKLARAEGFSLHLPPASTKQPYPLVVALHQLYGSAEGIQDTWGLDALADKEGFAVAYPNGILRSWDAGDCCGKAAWTHADDIGYLRALIAHLGRQLPIDEHRVVLFGLSNGGMLAYRYACEHPEEIAGIGVVSASLQFSPCQPAVPTTVVAITGLLDLTVPPEGDSFSKLLGTRVTSQTDSLAPFEAAARCAAPLPPPTTTATPRAGQTAVDSAVSTAPTMHEAICADGARILTYELPQGKHGWQKASAADPFDDGQTLWNVLKGARSPSTVPDL